MVSSPPFAVSSASNRRQRVGHFLVKGSVLATGLSLGSAAAAAEVAAGVGNEAASSAVCAYTSGPSVGGASSPTEGLEHFDPMDVAMSRCSKHRCSKHRKLKKAEAVSQLERTAKMVGAQMRLEAEATKCELPWDVWGLGLGWDDNHPKFQSHNVEALGKSALRLFGANVDGIQQFLELRKTPLFADMKRAVKKLGKSNDALIRLNALVHASCIGRQVRTYRNECPAVRERDFSRLVQLLTDACYFPERKGYVEGLKAYFSDEGIHRMIQVGTALGLEAGGEELPREGKRPPGVRRRRSSAPKVVQLEKPEVVKCDSFEIILAPTEYPTRRGVAEETTESSMSVTSI